MDPDGFPIPERRRGVKTPTPYRTCPGCKHLTDRDGWNSSTERCDECSILLNGYVQHKPAAAPQAPAETTVGVKTQTTVGGDSRADHGGGVSPARRWGGLLLGTFARALGWGA